MRKRRLAVVLAAVAAITLLPSVPALASAKPTPSAASGITLPKGFTLDAKTAKCGAPRADGTKLCSQIEQVPLSDLSSAQRAQQQRIAAAAPDGTAAATPPTECGFASTAPPTAVSNPTRFLSCSNVLWTRVDTEENEDGVPLPVGIFFWEDESWNTYSADSTSWVHDMRTIAGEGIGTLSAGIEGELFSNCFIEGTACIAVSTGNLDPQAVTLTPDSTYSYEWNEEDAEAAPTTAGAVDTLDSHLGVEWDITSGASGDPLIAQEVGDLAGRCDNAAQTDDGDPGDDSTTPPANPGPGCVDESYIPTLYLSLAKYGAAADFIQKAQLELSGEWGLKSSGHPLHRLVDDILQLNNREIICETDWTPDAAITAALAPYNNGDKPETDSCDEYPFASTYESGAMVEDVNGNTKPYVTTGANCAQFTAVQTGTSGTNEAADWFSTEELATPTGSEPCIRSHNPKQLNTNVGSAYSGLISSNRLVNKDPFWVSVTD